MNIILDTFNNYNPNAYCKKVLIEKWYPGIIKEAVIIKSKSESYWYSNYVGAVFYVREFIDINEALKESDNDFRFAQEILKFDFMVCKKLPKFINFDVDYENGDFLIKKEDCEIIT